MPTVEQLESLLEKEPDDVFVNFGLAMALAGAGRLEDALARFDRTLSLDPDYHAAHHHKAVILLQLGRTADARNTVNQGVAAARRTSDAHAAEELRALLDGAAE